MVLTLGVIIEETRNASIIHDYIREDDSWCNHVPKGTRYSDRLVKFCNKVKEADPWYYILLFATDIVFVLCVFVTLVLFADWILFVAPVRIYVSHNAKCYTKFKFLKYLTENGS